MKTLKMSLENIQGKMNRKEMRNIMAGSGGTDKCAGYRANCGSGQYSCSYRENMKDCYNSYCGVVCQK